MSDLTTARTIRLIKAQALRDAADDVPDYDLPFMIDGRPTVHVANWLRDRAGELEAQA